MTDTFVDDRGNGLRATWHPERGIVNLSLWRDDRCVETFWLPVADAGRLVSFLADSLTDAALRAVEGTDPVAPARLGAVRSENRNSCHRDA